MNIISLNCYAGRVYEPLVHYIKKRQDADVLLFQEMMSSDAGEEINEPGGARRTLLQDLQHVLKGHDCYFAPAQVGFDAGEARVGDFTFGNALFWKKDLQVIDQKDFFIYGGRNRFVNSDFSTLGNNAIASTFVMHEKLLTIICVHGTSEPAHKLDTPNRIQQSKKILDEISSIESEKVIMGDFNLLPNTKSIHLFEEAGYRNLITAYDIQTTRGSHMRTLFPEYEHGAYGFQEFADYTFVSAGIQVDSFQVPDVPISDHLPMIMDFHL